MSEWLPPETTGDYFWSDAAALYAWGYSGGEPSKRHLSARAYLEARLDGLDQDDANERANEQ